MRAWSTRREPGRGHGKDDRDAKRVKLDRQPGIFLCFSHFSSTTSLRIPWERDISCGLTRLIAKKGRYASAERTGQGYASVRREVI